MEWEWSMNFERQSILRLRKQTVNHRQNGLYESVEIVGLPKFPVF